MPPVSAPEHGLLAAMNFEVLEILEDGSLQRQADGSRWFEHIFPGKEKRIAAAELSEHSPYLENFLVDCAESWPAGQARLHSDAWVQRDAGGRECALDCWAVRSGRRRFLLVRLLDEEFEENRAALQTARESKLSNEQLGLDNQRLAEARSVLEERNREVERINRMKSEFLASMSHELRTPLNSIIGFSSLLEDGTAGTLTGEQRRFVHHVATASRHLLALINDVLDLSKIEAGRLELELEAFPLTSALEEVLSTIRPLAGAKNIELQTAGALETDVYADRMRVKQILYNLLSNAIKFTPSQGRIQVDAEKREGALSISVSDTGIGIPAEEHTAIFEKFHQAGDRSQGTGLGLAISKLLAEQQGGSIGVASEPGHGSCFTFTLPLAERAMEKTVPEPAPAPEEAVPANLRIAIIEDNEENRALLQAMLNGAFQLSAFSNAREALAALPLNRPDLVITDVELPGMTGLDFLARLRADADLRSIPVIAVSAHAMAGDRERFLAAGFDAYLEKPIETKAALLRTIQSVQPA